MAVTLKISILVYLFAISSIVNDVRQLKLTFLVPLVLYCVNSHYTVKVLYLDTKMGLRSKLKCTHYFLRVAHSVPQLGFVPHHTNILYHAFDYHYGR